MEKDFAAEGAPKFLPDKTTKEARLSANKSKCPAGIVAYSIRPQGIAEGFTGGRTNATLSSRTAIPLG
jgi:hypothetical protein